MSCVNRDSTPYHYTWSRDACLVHDRVRPILNSHWNFFTTSLKSWIVQFQNVLSFSKYAFIFKICFHFQNLVAFIFKMCFHFQNIWKKPIEIILIKLEVYSQKMQPNKVSVPIMQHLLFSAWLVVDYSCAFNDRQKLSLKALFMAAPQH